MLGVPEEILRSKIKNWSKILNNLKYHKPSAISHVVTTAWQQKRVKIIRGQHGVEAQLC